MTEHKRQQIQAKLALIQAWRASGQSAADFAASQGLSASHIRAYCSWQSRWLSMLADTPPAQQHQPHPGFVLVRPPKAALQDTPAAPIAAASAPDPAIHIHLGRPNAALCATLTLSAQHLQHSAPWLREVLS